MAYRQNGLIRRLVAWLFGVFIGVSKSDDSGVAVVVVLALKCRIQRSALSPVLCFCNFCFNL